MLMISIKNHQKLAKISLYLLARLVVQKLSIVMLNGQVQYQCKAGSFKLNFQFSNSQNTGKCELGRFLLRQAHIIDSRKYMHAALACKTDGFLCSRVLHYNY